MEDESEISPELAEQMEKYASGGAQESGTLVVDPPKGYVWDDITFHGSDLTPETEYQLRWNSVDGEWGVLRAHEIVGPQYRPRTDTIATVTTDSTGTFVMEWTVPEDFGGGRRIELVSDGTTVAKTEFEIVPHFEIDRTTAPLGKIFTITGYGISSNVARSNYQIAWDQGYTGFLTGVKNRGTATARIRAAGPPGEHIVQVWRNYNGVPYLTGNTQSPLGPVADGRKTVWTVEVTEPDSPPVTEWVDPLPDEDPIDLHYPPLDEDTAATLDVTPSCGQAGTTIFITGSDFPSHEDVDLLWYQHVGEGIRDTSVEPKPRHDVLPTVTTDADGSFQIEVEAPVAEGSTRPIVAAVDGREVAVTGFMVQPDIETFEPTRGSVGTEMRIEISGIGWTNYESTPVWVYDNHYLGYGCGMTDDYRSTTVWTDLKMAGEPGWHFIDIYPAMFRMKENEPRFEMYPHLSYVDNHPVRDLPAMHLAFEITE